MSILSEIEKAKLKFHCEVGMPPTFVCLGDSEAIALCHETQIHISQLSGGFLCGIKILIDRNTDSFLGVGVCALK